MIVGHKSCPYISVLNYFFLKFWGKQMPKTRYRYLALSDTYFSAWVPSLKLSQTCQGVKNFLQIQVLRHFLIHLDPPEPLELSLEPDLGYGGLTHNMATILYSVLQNKCSIANNFLQ